MAARVHDSAPESEWVANEMRRDTNQLRQNDTFTVFFDTFYDRRNGFNFYTNPLGARADQQFTNEGNPNGDWNPVWDVRTGRFDGGWTAEMEIPFKTLRYRGGGAQLWGVQTAPRRAPQERVDVPDAHPDLGRRRARRGGHLPRLGGCDAGRHRAAGSQPAGRDQAPTPSEA